MTTIRRKTKTAVDAAIAADAQPKIPKSGIGLVLKHGRQRQNLVSQAGVLTAVGKYYYEKTDTSPPQRFDWGQNPVRKGNSLFIKLLDGSNRAVSRFDILEKTFKPTVLGRKFFSNRQVMFLVLIPCSVILTRKNGSLFQRDGDYLPSTAISLGELQVNAGLAPAAQIEEVRRQTLAWLRDQPTLEGQTVLLAGYESYIFDGTRQIQYNKMEYSHASGPAATLHRPLTAGVPMACPFPGVCEEATQDTDENCVAVQLASYIRIKGKAHFTKQQLTLELIQISLSLYENSDSEDLLYVPGFTATAILKLCESYGIPIHIKWGDKKISSYIPENSKFDTVCVIIWGDHLFTIGDPAIRAAIAREPNGNFENCPDWILEPIQRIESKAPGIDQWELFTKLMPGSFYSRNINATRAALHRENICPWVFKSGLGQIKRLQYNDCSITQLPREALVCVRFLALLTKTRAHNVTYRAESFAGFGAQVFQSLSVADPRQTPTYFERQQCLVRSGGLCESCGDKAQLELDHTTPRAVWGSNDAGNFTHLCIACHRSKTTSCDANRLNLEDRCVYLSRFSQDVWEKFVKGRKPAQTIATLHQPPPGTPTILHCDIKSCRFNALVECNTDPIPVFSPMDEINKFEGFQLKDYMYVSIPKNRRRSILHSYVYDGPRFYIRQEVTWMLEHGVCSWCDILYSLEATSHRTAKELSSRLKMMKQLWLDVAHTSAGEEWAGEKGARGRDLLPKVALLALVGSWGRLENVRYITTTSSHPDDCQVEGDVVREALENTTFHDTTFKQTVRSYASFMPLNFLARALERVNVARAISILLASHRVERILSIHVDAVIFAPLKKREREITEQLQDITYSNVHAVTRRPLAKYAGPIQAAMTSDECIFTVKKLCQAPGLGGELKICDEALPILDTRGWITAEEPTEGPDEFHDKILEHILSGKSCHISGPPGVGKSFLLRRIYEALIAKGELVQTVAPTNAAARLVAPARTVHNFVSRMLTNSRGFGGTILEDECSMLSTALVSCLENLRLSGARIITLGDFNQLPPPCNSWRGTSVEPLILRNSQLLMQWSDHYEFKLTRCRRSNIEHFSFYTSILKMDLGSAITLTRATYQRGSPNDAGIHFAISHRKRRSINMRRQLKFSHGKEVVKVEGHDGEDLYSCCVGTPLVGSITQRSFVNGAFYTVRSIGETMVVQDDLTQELIECTVDQLSKSCCLSHCLVYNRGQGCTLTGLVTLHDFSSPHFRISHLYVGLSRPTQGSCIRIAA